MDHSDDELFMHATQIAERRIRIARSRQSHEVLHIVREALTWLLNEASKNENVNGGGQHERI